MAREIKFRVWNENLAKPKSNEFMDYSGNNLKKFFSAYPNKTMIVGHSKGAKRHLMQWTGKKDENEKEIYDGDVVEFYGHSYKGLYTGAFSEKGIITYSDEKMMFMFGNVSFYNAITKYKGLNAKIKVIGNIYENPELLES